MKTIDSLQSNLTERIQRIEHGLLPRIVIKGQPLMQMYLPDRMVHYSTPGLSLAVFREGAVEWTLEYGVCEVGGKAPIISDTLFQAGSISKPVTAVAALCLVEQGYLDLDEDVNERLVSWKIPENEFTRENKVSLRYLLSHSAGVTNHVIGSYPANVPLPTLLQALEGKAPATTEPIRVDTIPGTRWRYSGGGYTVIQQLLMDVTNECFPELVKKLIFEPLGMVRSTFQRPVSESLWSSAASGHDYAGTMIDGRWHVFPELAAAGLWSTPSELALFAMELQASWAGMSNKVLSTPTARQMLTRQIRDCGLGIFLEGEGRSARFQHGGDTDGYKCEMTTFLEFGEGAIIMTNADRGTGLAAEILRSLAHEYGWPDFQPEERIVVNIDTKSFVDYEGQYRFDIAPDIFAMIAIEQGRLMMEIVQPVGRNKAELLPEGGHRYFSRESGSHIAFLSNETAQIIGLVIHQSDGEFLARKTEETG